MVSQHLLHVRVWLGMFTVLSGSDFLKSWKFNRRKNNSKQRL